LSDPGLSVDSCRQILPLADPGLSERCIRCVVPCSAPSPSANYCLLAARVCILCACVPACPRACSNRRFRRYVSRRPVPAHTSRTPVEIVARVRATGPGAALFWIPSHCTYRFASMRLGGGMDDGLSAGRRRHPVRPVRKLGSRASTNSCCADPGPPACARTRFSWFAAEVGPPGRSRVSKVCSSAPPLPFPAGLSGERDRVCEEERADWYSPTPCSIASYQGAGCAHAAPPFFV
jgi:hypothetical protein